MNATDRIRDRRDGATLRVHRALTCLSCLVLAAAFASACAEGESSGGADTAMSVDVGADEGGETDVTTTDTGTNDTGSSCLPSACTIGTAVCGGPGAIIRCVDDGTGCGVLGSPESCAETETCDAGECVETNTCDDADNDMYGDGCDAGPDCDDTRDDVNPGMDEVCGDDVDNDCANGVDDGCPDPCADQPCVIGTRECDGADQLKECVADADGCGRWDTPVTCTGGTCVSGECQGCMDGDGDGRGLNCPLGVDCHDGRADIYDGAPELCDGDDNDCDDQIDEDFPTKGDPCTDGMGECERSGRMVCAADKMSVVCDATAGQPSNELCGDALDSDCDGDPDNGFEAIGTSCTEGSGECTSTGMWVCDTDNPRQIECDAPPPQGEPEICDGMDQNCDGVPDDGNVCSTCTDDSQEDDDRSINGNDLTSARTYEDMMLCGTDYDWFFLGTWSSGFSASLEIVHPTGTNGAGDSWADLNLDIWCDSTYCQGVIGTQTTVTFTGDSCCGTGNNVAVRVYPKSDVSPPSGTPYTMIRH